jgi:oligogalacturonide lyase
MKTIVLKMLLCQLACILISMTCEGQIGTRFPSEKKIVEDPVTGVDLVFLTSTPAGDTKIYPTHNQWTSDGEWLIFRSDRVKGEAMAVNEKTGDIVQVTEGGYTGTLCVARKSMRLFYMKKKEDASENAGRQIIEVDLETLFKHSKAGSIKAATVYQRVCGTLPEEMDAESDMALDADEEWLWFRVGKKEAAKHLPEGTKIEEAFGPRGLGAGPGGIAGLNAITGEIKYVVSVPFQVGHVQSNPWKSGEIVFCWETGGKAPQRTWIVNADGTGLRPLYPESKYEWVTHEAVIGRDEVAIAIMGHRAIPESSLVNSKEATGVYGANPGQEREWGPCGTREKPSGLGIVNIRTREMTIAGQTPQGSGLWHVSGSSDGRFATGDDFDRNLYLIDRKTREMILLTAGHKSSAKDHVHPTFSPDGTKIQIQSAMLSEDDKTMNICVVPVPKEWLKRK